tara:strand:- start:102 stop:323 length:222 start_codon:yes stop_codon:yes gene_type:complete
LGSHRFSPSPSPFKFYLFFWFAGAGLQVLTIHEAFEKIGFGWQQIRVLLICGLCFCTDSIGASQQQKAQQTRR